MIGAALQAYDEAAYHDEFEPILADYGLEKIDPARWYPQQLTLDVQKAIRDAPGGGNSLVSIGMKIIETAKFPPMESLEAALQAFAVSYPMNFRNQAENDLIRAERVSDNHIRVVNQSPHSDEMIYGYVYAMAKRFSPEDKHPIVKFEDNSQIDGDGDMIINVSW